MRTIGGFNRGSYVFSIALAAAVLAGCGGVQFLNPSQTKALQSSSVRRHVHAMRAIYSFQGHPDGEQPISNMLAPTSAPPFPQLIGTTEFGGYSSVGTVYGLKKNKRGDWSESVVYQFDGAAGTRPNGIALSGALNRSSRVFVTAFAGGSGNNGAIGVLQPNASGSWTLLTAYSFVGRPDGAGPFGPVLLDKQGDAFGTTASGGVAGDGTVYRLKPNGSVYSERVLYSFKGGSDGDHPQAGLTADSQGALYGTTQYGGASDMGTVFRLTPSRGGYSERVLYSFGRNPDGAQPVGGLCRDSSGAIYGTTTVGGRHNDGTVFRLQLQGGRYSETVLWNFGTSPRDGEFPEGTLLVDTSGIIYGTTGGGGPASSGSIGTFFTLKPSTTLSPAAVHGIEKLYYFDGYNGASPSAGPTVDRNGDLYIPAAADGMHLDGAIAKPPVTAGRSAC